MKAVPINIALLRKLEASGFNALIARAQAGNQHLVYIPAKQETELADNAEITALSNQEVIMISDIIDDFEEYNNKGLEIEVDEGI